MRDSDQRISLLKSLRVTGAGMVGLTAVLAGCTPSDIGLENPPILPYESPITTGPNPNLSRVTPTPSPELITQLDFEQRALAVKQMGDFYSVSDEFVADIFKSKALFMEASDAIISNWLKFNPDKNWTSHYYKSGPDGVFGYKVTNNYKNDRLHESSLKIDLTEAGELVPQIARFIEETTGRKHLSADQLIQAANAVFDLPKNLIWQDFDAQYEGTVTYPAKRAFYTLPDGKRVQVEIDATGNATMKVAHNLLERYPWIQK